MASLQVQGWLSKLISKLIPYWLELRRHLSSSFVEDEGSIRGRSMISGGGGGSADQITKTPLEPIPSRPLRGQGKPKPDNQFRNRRPYVDNKQDGFDLLEKFKLCTGGGFGNKGEMFATPRLETLAQQEQQQEDGKADTSSPSPAQDADEIFKKLKETGLIPNGMAMLDGLVQEAMKLFDLMHEKGTIPEVVIYAAIVEGFYKAHKFPKGFS